MSVTPVSREINGIVTGSVDAIVAVGMTMIFGVLRAINFAHGAKTCLRGKQAVGSPHQRLDQRHESDCVTELQAHIPTAL